MFRLKNEYAPCTRYHQIDATIENAQKYNWCGESHTNSIFNRKLYSLLNNKHLNILDLGCGGGGFVEECIIDGHCALGIEGYELYQLMKVFSWKTIPDNLKCSDITLPLEVYNNENIRVFFDVITAWDVLEHINPDLELDCVLQNIVDNLTKDGLFIGTISFNKQDGHFVNSKEWWMQKLHSYEFLNNSEYVKYFGRDLIRDEPNNFLVVLQRTK